MTDPNLLGELAKQGLLGVILALVVFAFYRKDLALTASYEKRVDDNYKLAAVIEASTRQSHALELTSENRSRVIESIGEATRAAAEVIKSQGNTLDGVRRTTEQNQDALQRLDADIEELKKLVTDAVKQRAG